MNIEDIQTHSFFKDENGEIWFVDYYWAEPMVSVVSTDSGYRKTFTIGAPLGQGMEPVELSEELETELRKVMWRAVRGFEKKGVQQ